MSSRIRLIVLGIWSLFAFSVILVRFYFLQVIERDKWLSIANRQHRILLSESGKRGTFFAHNSLCNNSSEEDKPLAMDVLSYSLIIDPLGIPEEHKPLLIRDISRMLHVDKGISSAFYKKSRYRKIAEHLFTGKKEEIERWWHLYAKKYRISRNALFFRKSYQRVYPFGHMLGQVLQSVRTVDNGDGDVHIVPLGGLEKVFHPYLSGKKRCASFFRVPRQYVMLEELDGSDGTYNLFQDSDIDGNHVYLTINHVLQSIVEEELARGIESVSAKRGMAIMMNPFSGAVYALAHYPFFSPERYRDFYRDKLSHVKIGAISDCFEPGSTMKPISMAIALKANQMCLRQNERPIFSPEKMISCDRVNFPGRSKPMKDLRHHRKLNMPMAMQKSSNIYPALLIQKVVEKCGASWYRNQLTQVFGFGEKSGIELSYENIGLVPTPGKKHKNGRPEWSPSTPSSLAIGYNVTVNLVQMAKAFSIFANGGLSVKPTLWRKIVFQDGREIHNADLITVRTRVLDEAIVQAIVKAMKYTTKIGGSGVLADVPGFTEVGKTSTSEKCIDGKYYKDKNGSSFVGFAPENKTKFVLLVFVDEPKKEFIHGFGFTHFGGKCAGPIFREISRRALEYFGCSPDDPYGYPTGDARFNPKKADWFQEASQLNKDYEKYNHS